MDYTDFKSQIQSKGYVYLKKEESVDWDEWLKDSNSKADDIINKDLPDPDENSWWDHSRNTSWLNENNVEMGKGFPSKNARKFIKNWISDYGLKTNESAQFAILLNGYPNMDCPRNVDGEKYHEAYVSYLQGNLHIDGAECPGGGAWLTSGLLVGVFLSEVENSAGFGRPIYFPGSHIEVMKLIIAGKTRAEARREVMKNFEHLRSYAHGSPGDMIFYHGALLHGMEPNRSGIHRKMVYFRKHFQEYTDRIGAYKRLLNK